MADNKNLTVQEILALCRQQDGEGGAAPDAQPAAADAASAEATAAPAEEVSTPEAAEPAAQPADKRVDPKKMSVADMLAAARAEKSGGGAAPPKAEDAPAAAEAEAAAAPAAKADPKKMSVADMLAAARAEKSGPAPAAKAKPAAKPAPQAKPAAKAASKAAAAPTKTGPMDTSSILAAARSAAKPGPMTKAEAAAKAKAKPEAGKPEKPKAPPMPPKPEYAKPVAPAAKQKGPSRRTMMEVLFGSMLAVGFGAMTVVTTLWALVTARFFFPNLLVEPPNQFKVGFPGDFSPGAVNTSFKAQYGVWVVNAEYEGQQQIVALKSVCTHLGCTPNWLEAEQKFKCPCHGSGFYKEGINFEGPAPRPLERYAIRVADDGQIEVDKSRTFQEQLGQWRDSASFVAV